MTEQQLDEMGPAMAAFLEPLSTCFGSARTFGHFGAYFRGALSDLPRKTAEPIALQAAIPVRTLQEFLRDHVWDFRQTRDLLQPRVASRLTQAQDDELGTIGLLDETSVVKKGDKTPGVQRQYLGCLGKVENGIVLVHLGVCRGRFESLLDADLFLPESWSNDRPRCREAGIPDDVVHRPKWAIALEQLDRAEKNDQELDWLTFDEGYGQAPAFLFSLDEREQLFIGEVPRTFRCLAATKSGRLPPEGTKSRTAEDAARNSSAFRSQPWQIVRLSRETMQDQVWRVKAEQVRLSSGEGFTDKTYWLIGASNDETGEEKFFLSNAPADASLETLVRVAFRRWNVEHLFRVCKTELGFAHFEGRNYEGLLRHLTICLTAMVFAAEQTERLRGEKSRDNDGAGVPGAGTVERGMAGGATRDERAGMPAGRDRLSPVSQPGGPRVEEEANPDRPRPQETKAEKAHPSQKRIDRSFKVAL